MNKSVTFPIYTEPYASGSCLLCLFGMASNSLIIAATLRKNSDLREKSNWLICILAMLDLLSSFTFLFIPVALWLDWTFVTNRECFRIAAPSIFVLCMENVLILAVSVDRLLILTKPLSHTAWDMRQYLTCMVFPAVSYGSIVIIVGAMSTSDQVRVPVCTPPAAMHGVAAVAYMAAGNLNCVVVTIVNVLCYCFSKYQANNANNVQNRLRDSVSILGGLYCVTQMAAFIGVAMALVSSLAPDIKTMIIMYMGWPLFINIGSNAIIYGARSKHYRKAYRKVLGMNNQVTGSQTGAKAK